jgi:hypothetical protein
MSPSGAPMNVYPCDDPSVRIQEDPIAPNGACETVPKTISGQTGGTGRSLNEFHKSKTLHLQVFRGALGRTRTCGLLIVVNGKWFAIVCRCSVRFQRAASPKTSEAPKPRDSSAVLSEPLSSSSARPNSRASSSGLRLAKSARAASSSSAPSVPKSPVSSRRRSAGCAGATSRRSSRRVGLSSDYLLRIIPGAPPHRRARLTVRLINKTLASGSYRTV